jgi:hypothetical protein
MDEQTLELVRTRRNELATYRKAAADATSDQMKRVKAAELALAQATKERDQNVAKFETALNEANAGPCSLQMRVGPLMIYGDRAAMGNQVVTYAPDTQAWVESSGSVYTTTSTRTKAGVSIPGAVVGGLIAGPLGVVVGGHKTKQQTVNQVHDDRTLFFEIRGSNGSASWQLPFAYESQARQAAAQVSNLASSLDERREDAKSSAEYYMERLNKAKEDTGDIVAARDALAVVKADNAEEAARQAAFEGKEAAFLALIAEINAQAAEEGEKEPFKADGTPRFGVDKTHDRPFVVAAIVAVVLVAICLVALL